MNQAVLQEILIEEFILPTEPLPSSHLDAVETIDTKENGENFTFHDLADEYSLKYGHEEQNTEKYLDSPSPLERRSVDNNTEINFTTQDTPVNYITAAFHNVHDKENFQAHVIEQIVHMTEHDGSGDDGIDFTTILPQTNILHHEEIKNPEIVEIVENVVFEMEKSEEDETPTKVPGIIDMQIDAIDIIPKDHHHSSLQHQARSEDLLVADIENDKFVGFKPTEDLVQPGEETTEPDRFGLTEEEELENDLKEINKADEVVAEIVLETLKIVGEFGRNLKVNDTNEMNYEASARSADTDDPSTTLKTLYETFEEVVTTISDGIVLSKELRSSINSFRDNHDEN